MEHISHGHNGQFFTPQHVSDLMAAVTCANIRPGQSVYDPTCGSGRMLLSAVKSLSRTNPNDRIFCYGSDIVHLVVVRSWCKGITGRGSFQGQA